MLQGNSPLLAHRLQNASLLILSLVFLPLDTLILIVSLLVSKVLPNEPKSNREATQRRAGFRRRTVLVTGVGMTKGLVLARLFHAAGHDVLGADFEPDGALVCGRVSSSLKRFYRLQKPNPKSGAAPYIQNLLDIVLREKVELWISCSGVASAVEDGMAKEVVEARTDCRAIQFDVKTTQTLHEKHSFMEHTKAIGLTVPETHEITSRAAVQSILRNAPPGRKYIMKTIGVDDSVRGDLTLLPKKSDLETSEHIARLRISPDSPWILQEFIQGKEYCTHSLVVRGHVKAFVACPSAELLMHYQALPIESALSQAMMEFTKTYAASGGEGFSGHLSFDFMVWDENAAGPRNVVLYPIECNPRAHTAVALFNGTATAMVDAYLSVLENSHSQRTDTRIVRPITNDKYYWTGHDLVTRAILPTVSFLTLSGASIWDLSQSYTTFLSHLFTWRDGTYVLWDPLPWWWLYHVYWPMRFWGCIRRGRKWSRINVSTAKMFEC
ncbi:uncharacterized protein Z520_05928 [Fonsecaea multimorphosa CBS 102226]|uniref:ATP-grasp domain-containing protein n=1 Tax=Fonsecaea multimorphosa CBS 102226 TaxID=1442371 RepID=A0A0D2JYK5_9EURO|nr:uncharacterized protein Z520_05928 [Fonsecaea multimorphosa CBS 102226]KIX98627.1 hypothetical protein Z520_05928 [Fonsecaea multimorphosa CBS 102226]OAL24816.1 hypothetical protein AYO22_05605 [Fonsecaea multimorphosa]